MPTPDLAQIDHPSAFPFDQTLARLSQAIADAGMQVFATIDHARNAREAGLVMPPSTVLIYGKAEGGTPIMLAAPRSALDLPLRVLVREEDGRCIVSFYPIRSVLGLSGVAEDVAARLAPAQALLSKAIT